MPITVQLSVDERFALIFSRRPSIVRIRPLSFELLKIFRTLIFQLQKRIAISNS
jgi:hypothetical protein